LNAIFTAAGHHHHHYHHPFRGGKIRGWPVTRHEP